MNSILSLEAAIENAKHFLDLEEVLTTIRVHPEWLTDIPAYRRWSILHHIIYYGDVNFLDNILATQQFNTNFRLLHTTRDDKTVLDIARLHNENTDMLTRIERLVALDEMLNLAIECQWDKCHEIVTKNPSYGNEKPPYRRYYLLHLIVVNYHKNRIVIIRSINLLKSKIYDT